MKQIIVNNISTWYYVTKDGRCYNSKTGKYLKGQENYKNGYFSYNIVFPDGSKHRVYAHRIVAIAYLSNDDPEHKTEVNHIDGNKLNNSVENLEWVTPEEKQQHALKTGLCTFAHVYCFTPDKKLVAEYKTVPEASSAVGVSRSQISIALNTDVKTLVGGFYWSREKELGQTKYYPNTGKAKKVYQYDMNGKFIMEYPSTGIAAKAVGAYSGSHIGQCCRGQLRSYKGFIWKYADDIVSTSGESQRDAGEAS